MQTVDAAHDSPDEIDLAPGVADSHRAFEKLMRSHNRRLFRVARAILKDDSQAEEALQESYLAAYTQMSTFRGDSKLGTWLTRITINECLQRLRKERKHDVVVPFAPTDDQEHAMIAEPESASPENSAMRSELRALLERKIDELPLAFRTVFIMREVEEMTVEETAQCLAIPEATVRSRLFRARALLRESLARDMDTATPDVFAFGGDRCDRIVANVLKHLPDSDSPPTPDGDMS
jgi:RNA polymerase sigma-70 factor, ECF subfamily